MSNWISNAAADIAGWVGSGVASLIQWLLGGIVDAFAMVIDAVDGVWGVLESLWNLGTGFVGSLLRMVSVFFPFLPEPVSTVISCGLLAVLIAGVVKKARGK